MAARINKIKHAQKTKELIRASQLLNRLTKCAKGEVEMTSVQVKAATVVINKEIPDLARLEHTGDGGGPVVVEIVRFGSNQSPA